MASASAAVKRGALGMNFNCCSEYDLVGGSDTFFIGQRFQEELNSLPDIDQRLFDRCTLRLAALQFRAPCVATMLVLFDHHAHFAHHRFILSASDEMRAGQSLASAQLCYRCACRYCATES